MPLATPTPLRVCGCDGLPRGCCRLRRTRCRPPRLAQPHPLFSFRPVLLVVPCVLAIFVLAERDPTHRLHRARSKLGVVPPLDMSLLDSAAQPGQSQDSSRRRPLLLRLLPKPRGGGPASPM